jgi:outer membrane lipoprotein-sorting protein
MARKALVLGVALLVAVTLAIAATAAPPSSELSAAEIVSRNVAARGGLQAWRSVQTLTMEGTLGAGGNQRATLSMPHPDQKATPRIASQRRAEEVELPFVMHMKRPGKMRLELQFNGKTAVQVFDGTNGWKLRPFLNRMDVEPYTAEEKKIALKQSDLDGPLVDYVAKGTRVELTGMDKVEGRDNYKLKVTLKSGEALHVWVDAQTFLDTKIEGQPRRLDGVDHPVEVYFRDYRQVDGLQIPFVLETRVLPVAKTALGFKDPPVPAEKITIEKVSVNPKLDDALFTKPQTRADAAVASVAPAPASNR